MAPVAKKTAAAAAAPTPPAKPAPAAAPATDKKEKVVDKTAEKTAEKKVVKEAPAPTPAPVAAETPVEGGADTSALSKLEEKVVALAALVKEVVADLKAAKKENERMRKIVERTENKRAKARSNPNGFAKPAKITTEMCDFLAAPHGTLISRTDVTRKINAYIKEHNLNKPENKRFILPDAKLRKILGTQPNEEISYFQLQRYISKSFVKST